MVDMERKHLRLVVSEPGERDEPFPGMEEVNLIEGMSYEERCENRARLLEEMSDRERIVHLINRVNEAEGRE